MKVRILTPQSHINNQQTKSSWVHSLGFWLRGCSSIISRVGMAPRGPCMFLALGHLMHTTLQIWHRKIGSGKEIANGVHSWFHLLHLALIQLKFLLISDSIYIYWSFPHWFECYHLICLFICGSIPSLLFYKSFCLILRYGTLFLIMVVLKHVLVYRRMSLPSSFFLFCFFFKTIGSYIFILSNKFKN